VFRQSSWPATCRFFFQAEDGIRDFHVTGVQTCALPICLTEEQAQLLENTYKSFVRGGANLTDEDKARLQQINQELAVLTVLFNQIGRASCREEGRARRAVCVSDDQRCGMPAAQRAVPRT